MNGSVVKSDLKLKENISPFLFSHERFLSSGTLLEKREERGELLCVCWGGTSG